jgi:hypothetical protein
MSVRPGRGAPFAATRFGVRDIVERAALDRARRESNRAILCQLDGNIGCRLWPAAKTTLARRLAPALGLPLIDRDDIHDRLFETKGIGDSA